MKKVLVAGGAGYVGTCLVHELQSRGYSIDVVDLLWFGNYISKDIAVQKKDIINLQVEDLSDYDSIIYLGGLSNDPMANYDPVMNFVENISGPTYLAFIAKQAGVKRFVFASSCSIYGHTKDNMISETGNVSPQYPYGIAKLAAETAIMNLTSDTFKPISLRKGTVGGYSPRMRFDLVVNAMTKTAITEGKIKVHNPLIWRPLVDVRDAAEAYICALEAPLNICGIYNICQNNYMIGDLAKELKFTLEEEGYVIDLEIKSVQDVRNYKVCGKKSKKDLHFVPRYTPSDSARHIIANMNKDTNLNEKRFYNIEIFKELF